MTLQSVSARKMMQNGGGIIPIALSSLENEHVCIFITRKGLITLKGGNKLARQVIRYITVARKRLIPTRKNREENQRKACPRLR